MRILLLSTLIAIAMSCSRRGESVCSADDECADEHVCLNSRCFRACPNFAECEPDEDCGQVSAGSPLVCGPRLDSVLASDFDQTCSSDADCTLVRDGDPCFYCAECETESAPINRSAVTAFREQMERAQQQCTVTAVCYGLSPAAFSCNLAPASGVRCTSGVCEAFELGFGCSPDDGCEYPRGCEDDSDCAGSGRCMDGECPPPCRTASDCPPGWLCDGSCVQCVGDEDCDESTVCTSNSRCVDLDDVHAQCADDSCPWNSCQEDRGYVDCRNDFLSARDFDQSCAADSDCAAIALELWNEPRAGTGVCECECFWQTVNTATETEYRSAATANTEVPQCAEPPVCDCGVRAAVCSNERCRIE